MAAAAETDGFSAIENVFFVRESGGNTECTTPTVDSLCALTSAVLLVPTAKPEEVEAAKPPSSRPGGLASLASLCFGRAFSRELGRLFDAVRPAFPRRRWWVRSPPGDGVGDGVGVDEGDGGGVRPE